MGTMASGRVEHGWTFSEIWVRPVYPVLLLFLNFAQSPVQVLNTASEYQLAIAPDAEVLGISER